MKRKLVASILGIVASLATVTSSLGQGQVAFNTYVGTVYQPIKYTTQLTGLAAADAALSGTTVGSAFHAALYYGLGNTFTSLSQLTLVPGSEVTVGTQVPGYVAGPAVTVPAYAGGPVTFAVVAWKATGANSQASFGQDPNAYQGASALWVETSIAIPPSPADFFQQNVPAITVSISAAPIPEPTTLALVGLGAAGLMFFRRRQ